MNHKAKSKKQDIAEKKEPRQKIKKSQAIKTKLARVQAKIKKQASKTGKIHISDIDIEWKPEQGTCTFEGLPVAMMWVDTTLAGVMSGVQAMIGTERFGLALQSEGRKSVEEDWKVIARFPKFKDGFKAIANIAAVAGWGEWKLLSIDEKKKTCLFRAKNSWEGRYQKALGVSWGSGMLAGKLAGYCSKLFDTNCWAKQTAFIARGDKFDEFIVAPSPRSIEKEIQSLLKTDKATRADMAVALRQLEKEVAERKQTEKKLRRKTEELDKYFTSALDLLCIADTNGFFRKLNPEWERVLGYTIEELQSRRFLDFVHPDDIDPTLQAVSRLVEQQTVENFINRYRHKDGTYRWIEWRSYPRGKLIYAVARDITEHKRAEETLRVSEEKYRLVVENANDAIFIVQAGIIKFPNGKTMELSGYKEKELTSISFAHFIHPDDKDMVIDIHRKRLQGQDVPAAYSFRIITKSGETLWVEASAVLVTWEGTPATLSFLRDITFQKKLEAQLLQAQKMEAIGQLAGGVAHDFNNLLTAIIGYGHLLKNEASQDDRMSAYVGQILSAAERAAVLTNDLLTFSRKQIVNLQPVNLNKIIKNMESLLLRVIGEDIELSTVLSDTDLTIMADSTQIDQILMNLSTNAQDAMPKGGSFIIRTDRMEINGEYIRAYGYGKPGSYALLSVEDTGTGMDERIRERIFEPFFTTKEVGKGTGLGLSMVYGIVKQHDGYINVYSEPGRGTTFKILLPLIQFRAEKLKPDDLIKIKGGNETILIGEDDMQVRNLIMEVLSHAGYHIIEAVDGEDAIDVFHKNKDDIQLLVLDVIMPKKNGKEVYTEIKKTKSDMKVIFVSGYSADIIHKKGILEVGLNFISKPVSPDELLTKVRDVLDN